MSGKPLIGYALHGIFVERKLHHMDLKTAMVLTRRFLAPTVVVILMLAGSMAWVWGEYKEVVKQRGQLVAERQAFNDEKLTLERHRADSLIALSERKAELDKREFIVQQREKDYQEQLSNLQQRVAEYDTASAKLKQAQAEVSEAQRIKTAEEKIERLMSEFSAIGANLSRRTCDDTEAQRRYDAAQAKHSEIYTLIKAYGLKGRYDHFLNSTRGITIYSCPSPSSWMKGSIAIARPPFPPSDRRGETGSRD
jgi:hypothetical protein